MNPLEDGYYKALFNAIGNFSKTDLPARHNICGAYKKLHKGIKSRLELIQQEHYYTGYTDQKMMDLIKTKIKEQEDRIRSALKILSRFPNEINEHAPKSKEIIEKYTNQLVVKDTNEEKK